MSLSTKVQREIFRASPYKIRELILFYAANQLPLQCFIQTDYENSIDRLRQDGAHDRADCP